MVVPRPMSDVSDSRFIVPFSPFQDYNVNQDYFKNIYRPQSCSSQKLTIDKVEARDPHRLPLVQSLIYKVSTSDQLVDLAVLGIP